MSSSFDGKFSLVAVSVRLPNKVVKPCLSVAFIRDPNNCMKELFVEIIFPFLKVHKKLLNLCRKQIRNETQIRI